MHKVFNVAGDCKPEIHYIGGYHGKTPTNKRNGRRRPVLYNQQGKAIWKKQRPFTRWRNIYRKSTWC